MTHSTIVAFKRRMTSRQAFFSRFMPVLLGALALVPGPAAWAASSTTTTLFTTPDTPSSGDVITMTAQVASTQFTVAGGSVTFTDTYNGVQETLGTVQVQSTNGAAGTAILKTEVGGIGTHQFVANYSGTQVFATSSSSVASVVFAGPYLTSTALTSSGTGPFTLTGTVSAYGPTAPTGSITFTDTTANFTLGTVPLNAATLQTGFAPYVSYPIAGELTGGTGGTIAPAIGDFNGDGHPDYAVPTNAGPIVILLGNGGGTFTNGASITTTLFTPTSAVVGDYNGDGKQDLAVLGATGSVNIYLGNGDGTFQTAKNYAVAPSLSSPSSRILASADFNRDGIADLVATNSALNEVAVLLGVGDGSFLAANYYSVATTGTSTPGSRPWNVVVGDLNKDGFVDIVTASDGSGTFSVLPGNGDGTFKTNVLISTPAAQVGSVAVGDFNGDGLLDVITSSAPDQNIYILKNTTTTVGANPTFTSGTSYPMSNGPYYLAIGDFNRDGKLDIIAANSGAAITGPPAVPAATAVGVLLGNGSGGFGLATYYQVGGASYFANAADINGDDQVDLTAVTTTGVSVLLSGEAESASLSNVSYFGCNAQSIVASYGPSGNYGASTSAPLSVTPGTETTALSLTVTPTNGVVGQQFMLQATLSPYNYGSLSTNGGTVTFKTPGGVTIGTATLSGGVATYIYTPGATGSFSVIASYPGVCGFSSSVSSTQSANVLKASILTWATPAPISYGTALNGLQLNATDSVPGTFAYTPPAGTVLSAGTHTLSVTFTPTDPTYGQETATVSLIVNPAVTIITWPTPSPITYGTPLSSFQLDATASTGVISVPLDSYYNDSGIYDTGTSYSSGGFDHDGYSYSSSTLSGSVLFNGMTFNLGPVNAPDAVYGTGSNPITLPAGKYSNLYLLGAMVNNVHPPDDTQIFTVTYTDGTTSTLSQNISDWFNADGWPGEAVVNCAEKRNYQDGSQQSDSVCVYGYDLVLDPTRTVSTVTLPNDTNIVILSMNLTTPSIPGTFVYTPPSGTVEPVGTDTLNVSFTPTDTTDYQSATGSVDLVVSNPVGTAVTPTISWPNPANITYGTPLSSTQLDAVAMGTPRPTTAAPSSQLNVLSTSTDGTSYGLAGFDGAGNTYSYTKLNNGAVQYVGATFNLGAPTVPNAISNGAVYTLPTSGNYSQVYLIGAATTTGQTKQPFVLNYATGNPVTKTLNISSWAQSAGYTDETIVATTPYANTQGGGENPGTYDLYGYTINADPTRTLVSVSVPNNRAVVIMALGFGTNTQVVVPGTYAYTPVSGTVLSVGTHTLSVVFTPSNTAGYNSASDSVPITVVKATPIINWPTPAAIAVGQQLTSTQLDATASVNGTGLPGTFVYTPAAGSSFSSAGTYTLSVTFTPNDTTDYTNATGTVQIVVGAGATGVTGSTGFQSSECCFFSQPTPYSITLNGSTAAPTGTVTVTFAGQTLGSATLVPGSGATSSASLMLNSIYFAVGNNTVSINYGGDTNYVPSATTAVIPLRNPAIEVNPTSVGVGSTWAIPYAFPVAGTMSFNFNPGGGGVSDFTNNTGSSSCSSGTLESAGVVCTLSVGFNPALPGIRRGVVQVNFTDTLGNAEPTLYLFLSGLGDAAQITLGSATQVMLNTGLNQPQSLTFNPTDTTTSTLYVANSNLGILDTVPSSGGVLTRWNAANTRNLVYPTDVVFDAFGNLIVADSNAAKVWEFNPSLAETTVGTGSFTLGLPTAARIDFANDIFIADGGATPRILMVPGETFDTALSASVLLSGSSVSFPQALAVDNTGYNLFVGDGNLNTIQEISLPGGATSTVSISPCDSTVTSCAFNSPGGMAFDPNGDMFVADSGQRVLMVPSNHSTGGLTTQLPITGLNNPTAIALDGSGNVYVTDLNTSVVKLLVNSGALTINPLNASVITKLTNTGNLSLTINSLTFGHGAGSSFTETDTCTTGPIAPGASCNITIKYSNGSGAATDTLTINSNAFSATGVTINLTN
jgi:hypothetical protein